MSRDFSRIDYDAPTERCALITWARSREIGIWKDTVGDFRWEIVAMRSMAHYGELERLGMLYFGPSPWRSSWIITSGGVLGELEKLASRWPPPRAGVEFVFKCDASDAIFAKSADTIRLEAELVSERPSRKRKQRELF